MKAEPSNDTKALQPRVRRTISQIEVRSETDRIFHLEVEEILTNSKERLLAVYTDLGFDHHLDTPVRNEL